MNYRRARKRLLILGVRILCSGISASAFSQVIYDPADPSNAVWIKAFDRDLAVTQNAGELECRVEVKQPALDFSLRYRTGYYATVPTKQFRPEETSFMIGLRVTSHETGAVYHLAQVAYVPAAPRGRDIVMNFSGGFEPGEGRYHVDWSIRDELGRRCRKTWDVALVLDDRERSLVHTVPTGTIRRLSHVEKRDSEKPYRVAVILNAAPIAYGSPRLSAKDQTVLIGTLSSVFRQTPFQQVSLSVVNIDKQREILSIRGAGMENDAGLVEALTRQEFMTIGFNQLRRPEGKLSLLAEAVDSSVRGATPDAVIFIGPNTGEVVRSPRKPASDRLENQPLFFYLLLSDHTGASPYQDTIEKLTKARGGRVFAIYTPKQLATALRRIEDDLRNRRPRKGAAPRGSRQMFQ